MSYASALSAHDTLMRLGKISLKMHETGVHIDQDAVKRLLPSAHRKTLRAKGQLKEVARILKFPGWQDLNPASHEQLNKFIFEHLQVIPRKWSKTTGLPSADKDLALRLTTDPNPRRQLIGRALGRFREAQKEESTWIKPLLGKPRIHPIGRPEGAKTGRWAYRPWPMQTWPQHIRVMLIPRPGWVLVCADKSQVELRIMAAFARDEELLEAYRAGKDVHAINAEVLFGRKFAQLPVGSSRRKFLRNLAKRFVYAVNYMADYKTVWRSLVTEFPHLQLLEVQQLCVIWFTRHPAIRDYARRMTELAAEQGGLEIPGSGIWIYTYGDAPPISLCANVRVQGAAAFDINQGIERLDGQIDPKKEAILLQVHDEIVGECKIGHEKKFAEKMKACLNSTVDLDGLETWLPVDVKTGYNWSGYDKDENPQGLQELH